MLQETLIGWQLNLFTKICFIISRHKYCTLYALMRYAHAHAARLVSPRHRYYRRLDACYASINAHVRTRTGPGRLAGWVKGYKVKSSVDTYTTHSLARREAGRGRHARTWIPDMDIG